MTAPNLPEEQLTAPAAEPTVPAVAPNEAQPDATQPNAAPPAACPGVTGPAGFRAAGVTAGLKASGKPDLALVVNDGDPAVRAAAGVFTSNRVTAAPVQWSRQVLADGAVQAVVLNSGGANACTGPDGFADTHRTAEHVAALLGASAADIAVCSTGLIGVRLDLPALLAGADKAAASLSPSGGPEAAVAIMTTDTRPKQVHVAGAGYSIGGMAKGAGMLAPALATMLVVLTTDAVLPPDAATTALAAACRHSFDRIDSDGCMSTNDTVLLLASGASGQCPEPAEFEQLLTGACQDLAAQLIADAEGASHDIAITVTDASDEDAALEVARAIARSNLLKAAIFGNDPNWGRILAAAGTVPPGVAPFDPDALGVRINGVTVCDRGTGIADVDEAAIGLSRRRQVDIEVSLGAGSARGTILTNDLTHDYVHENSAYST